MRRASGAMMMVVSALGVWGSGAEALAQEAQQDVVRQFEHNFDYSHDRGVFMRVGAGAGYQRGVSQGESAAVSSAGATLLYGVALGGYVVPRLALHASQWGQLGGSAGQLAGGVGQTFYVSEAKNLALSTSLGVASPYGEGHAPGETLVLAGEASASVGAWVGPRATLHAALVGGAYGLGLREGRGGEERNTAPSGWYVGLRLGWTLN